MKKVKKLKPVHDCPAWGKDTLLPRAFNTAYPDKMFYKCPMCGHERRMENGADEKETK